MKTFTRFLFIVSLFFFFCRNNSMAQTGCGWQNGDVKTYAQIEWGEQANEAGQILLQNFFDVYSSGIVKIGISSYTEY